VGHYLRAFDDCSKRAKNRSTGSEVFAVLLHGGKDEEEGKDACVGESKGQTKLTKGGN